MQIKKPKTKQEAVKLFNILSWKILEHKFRYYEGQNHKRKLKPISDAKYDKIEDLYRKLAEKLGLEPTAADMVGFDYSRPSCRIVVEKLLKRYNLN